MSLIAFLIVLAVEGLIIGALARLALPGKDPMSIPMTIGIGIAGSFIGGLLTLLITRGPVGWRVLRRVRGHRAARVPGPPQPRWRLHVAERRLVAAARHARLLSGYRA